MTKLLTVFTLGVGLGLLLAEPAIKVAIMKEAENYEGHVVPMPTKKRARA